MKKIVAIISSSTFLFIGIGIIILVACLMALDFFGTNSTDGYVADNMAYAEDYEIVLNENITINQNGYVPLERILYFYLATDNLSFSKIYSDNLDIDLKRMKPINDVCSSLDYNFLSVCNPIEIELSGQQTEYQNKPFVPPIDFSKTNITSFFMEERIVFGEYNVHNAWDFQAPPQTDVYSVCDGTVVKVKFPYSQNTTDTSGGSGNEISIMCNVDETNYTVTYSHLYPNSSKVAVGNLVSKNQVIASVGTTGYSTGNHLDFRVQLDDGTCIDGMSLIDFSNYDNSVIQTPSFNHNLWN